MKFVALFAALSALPVVLGLTVNTPANVVECEPTQLSWSGGTAPYYLTLIPAGQVSAPPFKQFPMQSGNSYTWLVDLQSGTSFNVALKDSTGATQYSDIITIQPGSSTACVNLSAQESGTGGSSPASTPASGAGSGSSASASPTTAAPSSSSPSPTVHNGASRLSTSATLGVAGIMGLIGAALF